MSATGLPQFDETVHLTNIWLKELGEDLGWDERHRAYRALRVALHALRDRLPVEVCAHLAAQLPMLIRGFYYEGWRPAAVPSRDRTSEDFVAHIAEAFANDPDVDPARVSRAVLKLISNHVSAGEVENVRRTLPEDIRALWPA